MSTHYFDITSPFQAKAIEVASDAFGVQFEISDDHRVAGEAEVASSRSEDGCVVRNCLVANDLNTIVQFAIYPADGEQFVIQGLVHVRSGELIRRLAKTTTSLLEREFQIARQDESLDDYASQISRDFEELVWTRELAHQIQNTDIRTSLSSFVDHIFPTLLETIQAQQLFLVHYQSEISVSAALPELGRARILSVGNEVITSEAAEALLGKYAQQARQQPVVVNHCSSLQIPNLEKFLIVPIQAREEEFGWIVAINRTGFLEMSRADSIAVPSDFHQLEFGTFEAGLMKSAASFLASHAKNTVLYREQEKLIIGVVRSLINTIDAKDHYTCGHSDRVAAISQVLARQLNLDERESEQVYLAGLLHDIGKVGVPDHILQKKGRLADEEFEFLIQHPTIGYHVLKGLDQISYVLPGVLHHHESFDGSGYPHGLMGNDIPLVARIIAVADAFDAMTSDRPYRKGLPLETAYEVFHVNDGPQWDPNVVEAFFESQEQIQEICRINSGERQAIYFENVLDRIAHAVGMTH